MHKSCRFFWVLALIFLSHHYQPLQADSVPLVLVSVAPHQFFVEKIADATVQVYLMIPAGASVHTYEPTPKQMVTASRANLWFCIGESFETRATQALKSHNANLKLVDLRQGLHLIKHEHKHGRKGCCPGSEDLHFWLSARLAQIQAETIANALIAAYPQHKDLYLANLQAFQEELQNLDQTITETLKPLKRRAVLVSHPAYAYFCRDYQLQQYSIEVEGKDPTPQQMTRLLNLTRKLEITKIFIQPQYNNKAARLVADELGATLIVLDPYSENYIVTMLAIAHAFADQP